MNSSRDQPGPLGQPWAKDPKQETMPNPGKGLMPARQDLLGLVFEQVSGLREKPYKRALSQAKPPHLRQEPDRDPGHGGRTEEPRSVPGHGNFYQKQQPDWMGLEQVAGGEPAPLSPEPGGKQLVAVLAVEPICRASTKCFAKHCF